MIIRRIVSRFINRIWDRKKELFQKIPCWVYLKSLYKGFLFSLILLFLLYFMCVTPQLVNHYFAKSTIHEALSYILGVFWIYIAIAILNSYAYSFVVYIRDLSVSEEGRDFSFIHDTFSYLFGRSVLSFLNIIWTYILMTLIIIVASLFLFIPGIYLMFAFAMTPYIIMDNPRMSAFTALRLSMKMMRGHMIDLLVLLIHYMVYVIISVGVFFFMMDHSPYFDFAIFYQFVSEDILEKDKQNKQKEDEPQLVEAVINT